MIISIEINYFSKYILIKSIELKSEKIIMSESELILNPKTNRYVKKTSQTGKRLLKESKACAEFTLNQPIQPMFSESRQIQPEHQPIILPEPPESPEPIQPIQTAIIQAGVDIVVHNASKFKGLNPSDMDALFKKLLLERLSISPNASSKTKKKAKKSRFKLIQSSSSDSDTS